MQKSFYCPICGAYQKQVDLTETGNTFVCDKCEATIRIRKFDDRGIKDFSVLTPEKRIGNSR